MTARDETNHMHNSINLQTHELWMEAELVGQLAQLVLRNPELENELGPQRFIRIHRAILLNAQTVSQQPSDPAPSPKPAPQSGGLKGSEVFAQSRTRNAPLREDQAKFNLGSKHLNAVTSSLQSGSLQSRH